MQVGVGLNLLADDMKPFVIQEIMHWQESNNTDTPT